jgi:NAD+ kinase
MTAASCKHDLPTSSIHKEKDMNTSIDHASSVRCGPFTRAAIVTRIGAPNMLKTVSTLAAFLSARGTSFVIETNSARNLGVRDYPIMTVEEIGRSADVAIVLGGDGTMLRTARQLAPFHTPLIGINHGRLGFMTDVHLEDMIPTLDAILEGSCEAESRELLEGKIMRGDQVLFEGLALNDIVIARKARIGLIELGIKVNNHFMSRTRSDGVIISSPTGSTAYGLAAGGPILHPRLMGIALTPIAPQALSNRPIIVPAEGHIEVTVLSGRDATSNFDMQNFTDVQMGDRILVKKSSSAVIFLHPKGWNHFDTLRDKLHWHEFPSADGSLYKG